MVNKPNGILYIGVTNNIDERVKEHKLKAHPKSFTAKYNCDILVYFEEFENGDEATQEKNDLKSGKEIGKFDLLKK